MLQVRLLIYLPGMVPATISTVELLLGLNGTNVCKYRRSSTMYNVSGIEDICIVRTRHAS